MRKERKIINTNIRLNLCDEQDRQSSVEAVEEALKKQQEAEKRMCSLELLMKMERRDAAC